MEEERAIMKAKMENPIVSEQVETFNAKLSGKEVVLKQAEVEVIATQGKEGVICRLVEEELIIEQDKKEEANKQADEGVVVEHLEEVADNTVDQFISSKEEGVSAPLPAYQPITSFSKPLAAEDDVREVHEEELGLQSAFQSELNALMPRVEKPVVNKEVTDAMKVEEEAIINQAETEVEEIITAKQEEELNENKVTFSMEDLEYDDATGQLFIHLESGMMEVTDLQRRDQLLAKMSSIPEDDNLLASIFPLPEARATPTLSQVPVVGEVLSATPPVLFKPINFRLQEQRLTFGHLGQSRAQSMGRWTSWTRDLLISDLEAAFTKPRRSIFWSDFSPEEKLACFDMVDWGATYPLDPPPRSLMFEPAEDYWSTWA